MQRKVGWVGLWFKMFKFSLDGIFYGTQVFLGFFVQFFLKTLYIEVGAWVPQNELICSKICEDVFLTTQLLSNLQTLLSHTLYLTLA